MPTTWNAIYLGQTSSLDPTENNTTAENAGLLVGQTFGAQGTPLSQDVVTINTTDRGGTAGVLDQDNRASNDRITYDIGAGAQTVNFDAAVQYNATLTYDNGSTFTGTFVIIQDRDGQMFLVPPLTFGPEFAALQANPIRSLQVNSVVGDTFSGLTQDRPNPAFLTCFASGTLIRTAHGARPVESLRAGDRVFTSDDGMQPLAWVGRQTVAGDGRHAPIRFRSGVMGNTRDLRVSPQHRMLVTGWQAELLFGTSEVLVPACHLVNDLTIRPDPVAQITYHHILFDCHQIVLAEDCPSESFFPGDTTMAALDAATRVEILCLFPTLATAKNSYGSTARMVVHSAEALALRRLCAESPVLRH